MKKFSLPAGSIVRSRKYQKAYNIYRRTKLSSSCQFCEFTADLDHVLDEHELFWIVRNLFPYHIWDGSRTGEHLMIVPKRHVVSIAELTEHEKLQYVELIATYESRGYSVYLRAAQSGRKTVAHQHTHLIEVGEKFTAQLFIERPHINITR